MFFSGYHNKSKYLNLHYFIDHLEWEEDRELCEVKHKLTPPIFELESPSLFPMTIIITPHKLPSTQPFPTGRIYTNGPGDQGSILGRTIPKTLKMVLIPPCLTLSNIRYVSRVKWSNQVKGVAPSLTPQCSSYWKRSLLVALNYSCQLSFTYVQLVWIPSFLTLKQDVIRKLKNCLHYGKKKKKKKKKDKII